MNLGAWSEYLKTWKTEYVKRAAIYFFLPRADRGVKLKRYVDRLAKKIAAHERAMHESTLGKKEKTLREAEFYSGLKADPEFISASAYVLARYINSEPVRDRLMSGDAERVLSFFKEIDRNPLILLPDRGPDYPRAWLTLLKPQIWKIKELLAHPELFPQITKKTHRGKTIAVSKTGMVDYDFVPVPRRIHGIWKGLPLGECIGGECKRFATVALKGTWLSVVENDGRPEGFVQIVPGKLSGDVYGSVDFGAPALAKTIVPTEGAATGPAKNLYEAWLRAISPRLPKNWKGLVVGADFAINNADVLPVVHESRTYKTAIEVGKGRDFTLTDPLATKLEALDEDFSGSLDYGNGMIFDAKVKGNRNRNLRLLNPEPRAGAAQKSAEKVIKRIIEVSPEEALQILDQTISLAEFLEFTRSYTPTKRTAILQVASLPLLVRFLSELEGLKLPAAESKQLISALTNARIHQSLKQLKQANFGSLDSLFDPTGPMVYIPVTLGLIGYFTGLANSYPKPFMFSLVGVIFGTVIVSEFGGAPKLLRQRFTARKHIEASLRAALKYNFEVPATVLDEVEKTRSNRRCRDLAAILRNQGTQSNP